MYNIDQRLELAFSYKHFHAEILGLVLQIGEGVHNFKFTSGYTYNRLYVYLCKKTQVSVD